MTTVNDLLRSISFRVVNFTPIYTARKNHFTPSSFSGDFCFKTNAYSMADICFFAEKIIVNHESIKYQTILFGVLFSSVLGRTFLTRKLKFFVTKSEPKYSMHHSSNNVSALESIYSASLKNTSAGVFTSQFIEKIEAMDGYFSRCWPQQTLAIISPL
jgi:ABC-type transport system involved in cytochrome bd biosynthesis fused ATPase/permease subunit